MKVAIRRMTRRDKPAIMGILTSTPQFLPGEIPVAEEVIDCYLGDPAGSGYEIYVAEIDSVVCGYVCFGQTPLTEGTWDVYWIAVASGQQRHGVGKKLMAWAESRIAEAGGRLVLVETSGKPSYDGTRLFYSRVGYDVVCTIPDFYASGDSRITFQKRLAQ